MEKPALCILGQAKQINNVETRSSSFLRDPFSATMNDFMVYCLNELADVLHMAIVHTYYQLPKKKRSHFYLVGYKERTGWASLQQKIYDDPSVCSQGLEIKWLLKNLRWYWKKYAEYMELHDDAFDDITGFLLFDVVQSAYADCETEIKDAIDEYLIQDCFQASLDLVIAISEAKFYQPISEDVMKNKQNLENMLPITSEFQIYQTKQKESRKEPLDTNKVIEFLKCDSLIRELEKEVASGDNPVDKPFTNYFLYTVMPRFENLFLINDSGIEIGTSEANTNINEQMDTPIDEVVIDNMPSDAIVNESMDKILLDSVLNETGDIIIPLDTLVNTSLDTIPMDPLVNTTMDGSIVVVNRYESTPVSKHRVLDRLRQDAAIDKIPEDDDDDNETGTSDVNKGDNCEGSFVII